MSCRRCGGSKHVNVNGRWVRCGCLQRARSDLRYRKAGIPERHDDATWKLTATSYDIPLLREVAVRAKALRNGDRRAGWILIHGYPATARSVVSSLVMRAACDGGMSALCTDVQTLVQAEFEKGSGRELYEVDAIAVEVGSEPPHGRNRFVVEKLIKGRWGHRKFTMFVTRLDPVRLASQYGRSQTVANAVSNMFLKVSIGGER